jgi:predicted xylose isomerase-like sugar epimerase
MTEGMPEAEEFSLALYFFRHFSTGLDEYVKVTGSEEDALKRAKKLVKEARTAGAHVVIMAPYGRHAATVSRSATGRVTVKRH